MSLHRDIVARGAKACGAERHWKWEEDFLEKFDAEKEGRSKLHARKQGESVRERMEVLRGLHGAEGVNHDKVDVWIDALVFGAECVDLNRAGLPLTEALLDDRAVLLAAAEEYPDVITAQEVEALAVATAWD